MMPLRASNINYNDLRHIIILGNERFISRWDIIWDPEIWLTLINARDLEMITLQTNNADIMVSTCTQPMTSIWQNLSKYLEMEISLSQDSNQSDVWKISPQISDKCPSEVQYSHQGYIGEVWQQDSDKESFSSSWEQPLRPGWLVKKKTSQPETFEIYLLSQKFWQIQLSHFAGSGVCWKTCQRSQSSTEVRCPGPTSGETSYVSFWDESGYEKI